MLKFVIIKLPAGKAGLIDHISRGRLQFYIAKQIGAFPAKVGLIDHFSPGRLQFTYIAKQQIHNSGFWW